MRALTLVAALLASALAAAQPAPTLVVHNARVFTADPDNPWVEAVAISGDIISAVGSSAEVLSTVADETRIIDAAGRLVVPGLSDAHVHVGAWPETVPLDFGQGPMPDPSLAEVTAATAAAAAGAPDDALLNATSPNPTPIPSA